jgi:hypothetical protein
MDSVRFGRALGFGARHAAKALVTAVDAASSPNPRAPQPQRQTQPPARPVTPAGSQPQPTQTAQPAPSQPMQAAARTTARAAVQVKQTQAGVARGGKRFGTSIWRPLVKLSGVLWLEMTGSFFALFALYAIQGIWTHRADIHETALNHSAHQHLLINCGVAAMFTYFSVSSFLKARRRSRSH